MPLSTRRAPRWPRNPRLERARHRTMHSGETDPLPRAEARSAGFATRAASSGRALDPSEKPHRRTEPASLPRMGRSRRRAAPSLPASFEIGGAYLGTGQQLDPGTAQNDMSGLHDVAAVG